MRRTDSAALAREGVTRTQLAVQEDLGWLFREQPTEDYGIDAQIEVVEEGEVLGRLLAVQIKSGESWFDEPASGGWWYRPDQDHVRYWLSHSLPVLVVLYDPRSETCYWEPDHPVDAQEDCRRGLEGHGSVESDLGQAFNSASSRGF